MSDNEDDDDDISADSGAILEQMDEDELREFHEIQCIGHVGFEVDLIYRGQGGAPS